MRFYMVRPDSVLFTKDYTARMQGSAIMLGKTPSSVRQSNFSTIIALATFMAINIPQLED